MPDHTPAKDLNKKPRRGLNAEERGELFREFKLGLCALTALVILVVTLCWDRNRSAAGIAVNHANKPGNLSLQWHAPKVPDIANIHRLPEPPRGEEAPAPVPPPPQIHLPPPASNPPPDPTGREYIVKKGDNPWTIAARTLADGRKWKLIQDANPGLEPRKLKIGRVLRLPPAASAPSRPVVTVSATTPAYPEASPGASAPAPDGGTQLAHTPPKH